MGAERQDPRVWLERWFQAALAAVDPARCLPPMLPEPGAGRTVVVGAGKAAASMAAAVETNWTGPLSGTVIVPYGHAMATGSIVVREAGHPVPDEAGVEATQELLGQLDGLGSDDLVLVLLSGGGSALLTAPAPPLTLAGKQATTRALLRSGAPIDAINTVRRHLSAVKGGRLAARAHPARVVTLLISDVPGDDPATIASGPTSPDTSTPEDARRILDRYQVPCDPSVTAALEQAQPPPRPDDARLRRVSCHVVAGAQAALQAAAQAARADGVTPLVLGDTIEGEAREVARVLIGMGRSCRRWGAPVPPPCVLLSGGETSVTVRGSGRGGRNTELALAAALAADGIPGFHLLCADTDGIDGSEDNAGALVDPATLERACAQGLDAWAHLAKNDSYGFFEAVGGLLHTGPTLTNVNDFRALLVP
ncbi:glycerate kinase type-2 family protein [Halorhodospira halophila]|uniref:glycerate kinase type-2 family protein n=1 Tax=Halorhodospira halophila TaxID=1053 RepID=UPI001911519D|nr:glycerate kinase [Halorhodospira halophila]MBK5942281.1 glycerate kinase [Halorhodospira halophila]